MQHCYCKNHAYEQLFSDLADARGVPDATCFIANYMFSSNFFVTWRMPEESQMQHFIVNYIHLNNFLVT